MNHIEVTGKTVRLVGGLIQIDARQAKDRADNLRLVDKEKWIYEILKPVEFKRGEILGVDLDETNLKAMPVEVLESDEEGKTSKAPTEAPERINAIVEAVGQLEEGEDVWTTDDKPKVEALEAILGWELSAAERDAAVEQMDANEDDGE